MIHNIPKIIWQTHNYEYPDLPLYLKQISQTWKNLNPDWEYRYVSHTEREEIIKKYPILWKYYPTQDPVCQADMWRYVVTYEHGGVYADMDSICTKPLTYMLSSLEDAEIFVCPPNIQTRSLQSIKDGLTIRNYALNNYSQEEIDLRLRIQTTRNGVSIYESESGIMVISSTTKSSNYAVKQYSQIMKHVIEESQNHFIKNISDDVPRLKLYVPFLHVLHDPANDQSVSFKFDAFHHDDLLKTDFNSDFLVNDYGTSMKYDDYLNKYNLPMY